MIKQIQEENLPENTRLKMWYLANGFIHKGTSIFAHLPFTAGFMELPCKRNDEKAGL